MDFTYVVVLDKLAASTNRDTEATKHALVLSKIRLPVLLILNVHVKGFAFKEDLQVTVMLENRVGSNLVQHAFECCSSRLDEVCIKPPYSLLLGRRSNDHTGVVVVQGVV